MISKFVVLLLVFTVNDSAFGQTLYNCINNENQTSLMIKLKDQSAWIGDNIYVVKIDHDKYIANTYRYLRYISDDYNVLIPKLMTKTNDYIGYVLIYDYQLEKRYKLFCGRN